MGRRDLEERESGIRCEMEMGDEGEGEEEEGGVR
jgi:hypothetical protein